MERDRERHELQGGWGPAGAGAGASEGGGLLCGRGVWGVAAFEGHLRTLLLFSGVKKEGPDSESPAPSLPVRISSRKMNITRFPFAMGQRGGKRVRALHTSDV